MATYYIDGINGNDSNAGTASNTAWKTFTKIENGGSLVSGDIVYISPGAYDPPTASPTANIFLRCSIDGDPDSKVIITSRWNFSTGNISEYRDFFFKAGLTTGTGNYYTTIVDKTSDYGTCLLKNCIFYCLDDSALNTQGSPRIENCLLIGSSTFVLRLSSSRANIINSTLIQLTDSSSSHVISFSTSNVPRMYEIYNSVIAFIVGDGVAAGRYIDGGSANATTTRWVGNNNLWFGSGATNKWTATTNLTSTTLENFRIETGDLTTNNGEDQETASLNTDPLLVYTAGTSLNLNSSREILEQFKFNNDSPVFGSGYNLYGNNIGYILPLEPPTNINASKGLFIDKIIISWDDSTEGSPISEYDIYRNGEKISTVSYGVMNYEDITAESKNKYLYSIVSKNININDSQASASDIGYLTILPDKNGVSSRIAGGIGGIGGIGGA